MWNQIYDPLDNKTFSTLAAALPVVVLLGLIASNKIKAHFAAILALVVANLVAIYVFTMPACAIPTISRTYSRRSRAEPCPAIPSGA